MSLTLVVGYDGSPASRAALSSALDSAGPTGSVIVVHACAVPANLLGPQYYGPVLDQAMQRGTELLDRLSDVDPRAGEFHVETELVASDAATALARIARTRQADGVFVGTRGHGRARALLGSVAHELIHRAECPVTVIPERAVVQRRAGAAVAAPENAPA